MGVGVGVSFDVGSGYRWVHEGGSGDIDACMRVCRDVDRVEGA